MSYFHCMEYIYQRLFTLTTMVWKGPVNPGEYGSPVPVKEKQRPQASPGPPPCSAPKAYWFIAAENPFTATPQAMIVKKFSHRSSQMRAVVIITSSSTIRVHGKGRRTRGFLMIFSFCSFLQSESVDSEKSGK